MKDSVANLLRGGYDLHVHPIPSHAKRSLDDFELVEQATAAGMAGVLIKNHYESTAARAALVNHRSPEGSTVAYGAVVLNYPAGGLNPYAVYSAMQMGAKFVYMATRDAKNCLTQGGMAGNFYEAEGVTVLDDAGELLPAVFEIMDVVKKYDGILCTGHISTEESIILCRAGAARGVRMALTHPEFILTIVPAEIQRELADLGIFIEKCWYNIGDGSCTAQEMVDHIRTVGVAQCFLSTDRGQAGLESPVEGMSMFIEALMECGITEDEIKTMLCVNPRRVLGLPTA